MALYDAEETQNGTLYEKYVQGQTPVLDPYTRSLAERGIQNGTAYPLLTPEGYDAELARRRETLQQAVVPETEALLDKSQYNVRRQMASAGKLSSSATTTGMMRTGELYAAQMAGTLAQGELGLYEQLDAAKEAELNRIYGSGVERFGAEQTQWQTAMGAEQAGLDRQTQERIAQIQADTTLSGYDKQVQIANIQAQSAQSIAQLQSETSLQLQTQEQQFYTDPETGKPNWWLNYQVDDMNATEQWAFAREQLTQQAKQFNVTTQQGWSQFRENMEFMRDQFETETEFKQWEQDY
ncbi:MAG: hypothetical protein KKH61_21495, partial [Gammaproteobacteria bacterium]|nr:hypothetical protein [Gammaproteobacteria bacterium]